MINYLKSLRKVLNHPENRGKYFGTLARISWWKVNQLFFRLPATVEFQEGFKCICYPNSSFGGLIIYEKYPEYWEMKYIYKSLKSGDVFVDVGAGIGEYSFLAACKSKKNRVYSFEPSLTAMKLFEENLSLNKRSNIKVYPYIVSNHNGYEQFTNDKNSEEDHINYGNSLKIEGERIKSITLDSFLSKRKVDIVDFVKIDVEGAELKVLEGCERYLSTGRIKKILLEINPKSKFYDIETGQTISYLEKHKYSLFGFTKEGRLRKFKESKIDETTNILATLSNIKG